MTTTRIFTVSELNASIRGLLEVQFPFVSVAGEISNLRRPLSGHFYFTLKEGDSQIRAVLFKMQQRYLAAPPADGQMVVCRGRISVYEPRGEYQLIVDTLDFQGVGVMQLQFEQLKQKLAAEGLFEAARKMELPPFPEHITLITSPKGAAVHDFIRIARSRSPQTKLSVYPVAVQGASAAPEIAEAIAAVNSRISADIIVLCRGGGSIEDLWAFNEEKVARAVAASEIPVVSAIGHEIDYTLADFAADLRAPTPSAAAEMVLPDAAALRKHIRQLKAAQVQTIAMMLDSLDDRVCLCMRRMRSLRHPLDTLTMKLDHAAVDFNRAINSLLLRKQHEMDRAVQKIQQHNPVTRLMVQEERLGELSRHFVRAMIRRVEENNAAFSRAAVLLDAVSPLATLARGYSIARTSYPEGTIITDAAQVSPGDRIDITLQKGFLKCLIEKTGQSRLSEE